MREGGWPASPHESDYWATKFSREEVVARSLRLVDAKAPFLRIPDNPPQHQVLAVVRIHGSSSSVKIRVEDVEMVYNDSLMMDATGGTGSYAKTLDDESPIQRIAYEITLKSYEGIELPQIWKEMLDETKAAQSGRKKTA